MIEQSNSERGKGNSSKRSRTAIYKTIAGTINSEVLQKRADEIRREKLATMGNGRFTIDGTLHRENGCELLPLGYDGIQRIKSDEDLLSYIYGYYVRGNRRILGIISILEKEEKYDDIISIGAREYQIGITEDKLGELANNKYYMSGYNSSKNRNKR